MLATPNTSGFFVGVRDLSKPRNHQAVEKDLYTRDPEKAKAHHAAMVSKYAGSSSVKVMMSECVF